MTGAAPTVLSRASASLLTIGLVESRRDLAAFIRLPRQLYRGMPGYIAPLDFERRSLLDPRRAAFFKYGRARYWLARRNGQVVGRIAAQIDPHAIEAWKEPIGCFGALDAADDREAVAALVAAAAGWLRAEGMERMRGPFTLSINGETGIQISGQENGSMILMPWHPPYLAGLVETTALIKAKDVLSFTLARTGFHPVLTGEGGSLQANGLVVRGANLRKLKAELAIIVDVFNQAWRQNWGFVPLSPLEAEAIAGAIRPIINSDSAVIIEKNGRPVATALLLANVAEYIADMDGRLFPFNWLRFLWRARRMKFKSSRLVLFGMDPALANSLEGMLIPILMLQEFFDHRIRRYEAETVELGWILEDKSLILKILQRNGGVLTRRHRIYEAAL